MKRFNLIPLIAVLCFGMLATVSTVSAQVAQINGQDVALSTDTVINPPVYGSSLKGVLLDSGISFILINNANDGMKDAVTVFNAEDVATICSWDASLVKEVSIVYLGTERSCSE